jgi:transcriptional regulator
LLAADTIGLRASSRSSHLDVQQESAYPPLNAEDFVADDNTDVIQGTLDMLILKTLSLEPLHGFGIARRIEQISRDVFKVNPGSLLVALRRLERSGWLDAEWRESPNARRAKYYMLTRAGRRQLDVEAADWKRRAGAVARLLNAEG